MDMSEMKREYVNVDGSEMTREDIIALFEKEKEENERKAQKICDLLKDKRDTYVKACKDKFYISSKAELYAVLPKELREDEAANDILRIDGAVDVMSYIHACIYERVPTVNVYDEASYRWKDRFTREECKMMHTIIDGTFEDACTMFTLLSPDELLDKKVLDLDVKSSYYRMIFNGLKLQWKMINEQLDGSAGLRALFG